MAHQFKRKESVPKAIRRLGRKRVESALKCLNDCADMEAVHGTRKEIKKLRATLRLSQSAITKKDFRRVAKLLREAANELAPPRDAFIKAKTLRDLARHFKGQVVPSTTRQAGAIFRAGLDAEIKGFREKRTERRVETILRNVGKEWEGLEVKGKGWKTLAPAINSAYRQGRSAYQTALRDGLPESFHEWRKRAKDLLYQVNLLRPVWPEQMDALGNELETLTECLGDDHDLMVLGEALEKQSNGTTDRRKMEALHGLIEQRQRELRSAALALGSRFYAEKPSTFCRRLEDYWRIWRREKKRFTSPTVS